MKLLIQLLFLLKMRRFLIADINFVQSDSSIMIKLPLKTKRINFGRYSRTDPKNNRKPLSILIIVSLCPSKLREKSFLKVLKKATITKNVLTTYEVHLANADVVLNDGFEK